MSKPITLVTAATGKTGTLVVEKLIAKGFPVRALVRRLDDRSARLESLGAEVVLGDLLDIELLRSALDGVKRAYFVYPPADRLLEATTNFAQAAKERCLESVVNMSQIIARAGHPSALSRQHWLAERVLDWADVGVIHIRPTFFAEMPFMLNDATISAEGKIYQAHGDGRHAPVTSEDIARVVAVLLENPQPHSGKTYVLTGPEAMTQHDIASAIAKVLGKPIDYVDIPADDWKVAVTGAGLPAFVANHLGHLSKDYKEGRFDQVTDAVLDITGAPPQSFETFVRENADALVR